MPRVSKHRRSGGGHSTPHKNSPINTNIVRIPLNDDMGEKAARMEARQARHDRQMDQIKAAVKTPMPSRRYSGYERESSMSPATPRGSGHRGRRESDVDGRRGVTPMKRVPILANFEEWMKMATDNKINANNSWNFALIDYFHDMSLLKEGDGVNFQKASCTLDGCVKIYTSRVDSVATETGKLLSGLADSRDRKAHEAGAGDGAEDEDEEDGEEGATRKSRRKAQRSHEATLAPSFASLQLKKFELEFSVDPLFKKASADFDEGGAKGLLLNHLAIDGQGRIVFDSSDDATEESSKDTEEERQGLDDSERPASPSPTPKQNSDDVFEDNVEIDITSLANQFFPDLDCLEAQDICPSLKNFDLGDPSGSLDLPFLKAPEDWRNDKELEEGRNVNDASGIMLDDDNAVGFDDDDATLAGFDLGGDAGFGEGGEAWARDAALEPMLKVHRVDRDSENQEGEELENDDAYAISLSHQPDKRDHENILSYFDNALQKNWAGPEHWKIRRIKEHAAANSANAAPKQRKEKEPFEIDFSAPLDPSVAELIYTPASSNSTISLPKTQWKTKGRNLLPDDKHFNSRQLLRLFLKPKARMGSKRLVGSRQFNQRREDRTAGNGDMDEAFWANHKTEDNAASGEGAPAAYDADFFADDDGLAFPNGFGLDDDDENLPFADAREMLSPPPDGHPGTSTGDTGGATGLGALLNMVGATPGSGLQTGAGGFGSQLVTQGARRARPDYVAYARVAKKVDVRRLKVEMWKGMGERLIDSTNFDSTPRVSESQQETAESESAPPTPTPANRSPEQVQENVTQSDEGQMRFTQIMNSLKSVYPPEKLRDISTSFGFICLLHLANEQGLILQNDDGSSGYGEGKLEEIFVKKDLNAILDEGAI
ncbi:condensin complex subunit 2/barren [Aspergillus avenaceus]|uniref:Condensin complex subunit 2 n=1 Tax=Aspergillus avenaceus TaxID=36643 RepID=A0A5N6TDL1_ASPAV|nr:condensin complex subunit 2/barren [Aspergillus avenaceus]